MQCISPPRTEQELLLRSRQIAGKSLSELAKSQNQKIPQSLSKSKGWIGQLIELALGAPARNLAQPDFLNLGIELKTIPINSKGQPQESTFVCTASFREKRESRQLTWHESLVYQKLKRVLFVPIEANSELPLDKRRIGGSVIWSPDTATENILRTDWEELQEMLDFGRVNLANAHFGTYLQLRPKAAHSRILQTTINECGEEILAGRKGFYLRTSLTKKILAEFFF